MGRAHRPGQRFAACSDAAAHFDGTGDAAVFGEVEPGRRIDRAITSSEAQIRSERRRVDDLAWIENAQRIEGALDFAKRFVEHVAEQLAHERAAYHAIAVLSG